MTYALECRLLGTENCEDVIRKDGPTEGFVVEVFRHLEQKHRQFLLEFYKKSGLVEIHRLITDRTDRIP